MGQRRGGRGLDPETALEISLNGTAGRLAADDIDVADAIEQLRDLAAGRTDLLAKAAGTKIGGYLGSPLSNPNNLKAAYLLHLAGAGDDHASLVAAVDTARRNIGGSAYRL